MNIKSIGNIIKLALYGSILGAIIGIIAWLFLFIVNESIHIVWVVIPETLGLESGLLILSFCVLGGVIVGLCQKNLGAYPKEMDEVFGEFRNTKRVDYSNLHKGVFSGYIVLLFGASLGPEATLVSIIGGLCTWVSDKLWVVRKKRQPLSEKGMKAKTSYYIKEPLNRMFISNKDEENIKLEIPKYTKYIVYSITAIVGYWVFSNLFDIAHLHPFIIKYGEANISLRELVAVVPLILLGLSLGYFYKFLSKGMKSLTACLSDYKIIKATIGGFIIGLFGIFLPLVLFSGENEIYSLVEDWQNFPIYVLLIMGIGKMFLTQICLKTGWRGGQIYPLIFSGTCIGFGVATIFSLDPISTVAVLVTSILCVVIKQRNIIALLLCLFFPWNTWLFIGLCAVFAGLPTIYKKKFAKPLQNEAK